MPEPMRGLRLGQRYRILYAASSIWALLGAALLMFYTDDPLYGMLFLAGALVILGLFWVKRHPEARIYTSLEIVITLIALVLVPLLFVFPLLLTLHNLWFLAFFLILLLLEGLTLAEIWKALRRSRRSK